MNDGLLLGIDVGTSSCKAVVVGTDGIERVRSRRPTPWQERDGRRTLDGQALLATVVATCDAALAGMEAPVLGVGVTSMAEAGFLHDREGRAIAPARSWHDTSAAGLVPALRNDLPSFTATTGLPVGAKPTLVNHRWRRDHEPALAAAHGWLNVAEFVVHALGGARTAEPSLASRTGWLDVHRLAWWPEALAWSQLPAHFLPPLQPAGTPAGTVAGAARLAGAVLTVAGHDHLCAALGVGAVTQDVVVDSCGSAEALVRAFAAAEAPALRERAAGLGFTSGRHVLADRVALVGGFPSGARLARLAPLLGYRDAADADHRAQEVPPPVAVIGLDQVDGWCDELEAAPRRLPAAEAARRWRAAAEAVAATAAERLATLLALSGPAQRVITTGGSSGQTLVAQARRRRIPRLSHPAIEEAAARGAAVCAAAAAGVDLAAAAPVRASIDASAGRYAAGTGHRP